MTKTQVKFNANAFRKALTTSLVEEQTQRLIAYAKKRIMEVGDKILSYASRNHMDRTGHLLDSLCWGVTYNGEMKDSGFYREKKAVKPSFLHEFFPRDEQESVDGHALAQKYLSAYKASANGWEVFVAILAPYWGYWERGFTMKGFVNGLDPDGERKPKVIGRFQHSVIVHEYIQMIADLKPAKVTMNVFVPKYSYKNRKYKNRVGYRKIGLLR